jgi:hypothetical protein
MLSSQRQAVLAAIEDDSMCITDKIEIEEYHQHSQGAVSSVYLPAPLVLSCSCCICACRLPPSSSRSAMSGFSRHVRNVGCRVGPQLKTSGTWPEFSVQSRPLLLRGARELGRAMGATRTAAAPRPLRVARAQPVPCRRTQALLPLPLPPTWI